MISLWLWLRREWLSAELIRSTGLLLAAAATSLFIFAAVYSLRT